MATNVTISKPEGKVKFTAGGTIAGGAPHEIGALAGINLFDVVNGDAAVLQTGVMGPVVQVTAPTDEAWAQGALLYKDGADITTTAGTGDNPVIGYAYEAKLQASAVGYVILAPGPIGPGAG